MNVTVYHAEQCDPKKCTTVKLQKQGKIRVVTKLNMLPRGALVLDPFTDKVSFTRGQRNR